MFVQNYSTCFLNGVYKIYIKQTNRWKLTNLPSVFSLAVSSMITCTFPLGSKSTYQKQQSLYETFKYYCGRHKDATYAQQSETESL